MDRLTCKAGSPFKISMLGMGRRAIVVIAVTEIPVCVGGGGGGAM